MAGRDAGAPRWFMESLQDYRIAYWDHEPDRRQGGEENDDDWGSLSASLSRSSSWNDAVEIEQESIGTTETTEN